MSGRTAITELGPDAGALREEDADAILFDLGIGAPHCDICVRTADPEILRALRSAAGRPVLAAGLFAELPAMSPARVFVSRLGRIEVRTPIPKPEGKTPDGPHTHVLPELLRHRRTHSANVPLPEWMVPCAEIFPASSIHDAHGRRRPFNAAKHEAFQKLLLAHGDPACLEAKSETVARCAQPDRRSMRRRTPAPSVLRAVWRSGNSRRPMGHRRRWRNGKRGSITRLLHASRVIGLEGFWGGNVRSACGACGRIIF